MNRLAIAALLALAACPPAPVPPPPPDADAAPVDDAAAEAMPESAAPVDATPDRALVTTPSCGGACAVLAWVGCPEGNKTPKGRTCEEVCESTKAVPNVALPTACVSVARTIDQVRKCGVKCK